MIRELWGFLVLVAVLTFFGIVTRVMAAWHWLKRKVSKAN